MMMTDLRWWKGTLNFLILWFIHVFSLPVNKSKYQKDLISHPIK